MLEDETWKWFQFYDYSTGGSRKVYSPTGQPYDVIYIQAFNALEARRIMVAKTGADPEDISCDHCGGHDFGTTMIEDDDSLVRYLFENIAAGQRGMAIWYADTTPFERETKLRRKVVTEELY